MRILDFIKRLFHKKKVVMKYCNGCRQDVALPLYKKKTKNHKIGTLCRKTGKTVTLYCNGKEI